MISKKPPRNLRGSGDHGPSDAVPHPNAPNSTPKVRASQAAMSSPSAIPAGGELSPENSRSAGLQHVDSLPTTVHIMPRSVRIPLDPADLEALPPGTPGRIETDRFLKEIEASRILSLSPKTLQAYRQSGKGGPAYHVLGQKRGIRYRLHELLRWASAREVRSR
jgi:hypothetical protein